MMFCHQPPITNLSSSRSLKILQTPVCLCMSLLRVSHHLKGCLIGSWPQRAAGGHGMPVISQVSCQSAGLKLCYEPPEIISEEKVQPALEGSDKELQPIKDDHYLMCYRQCQLLFNGRAKPVLFIFHHPRLIFERYDRGFWSCLSTNGLLPV